MPQLGEGPRIPLPWIVGMAMVSTGFAGDRTGRAWPMNRRHALAGLIRNPARGCRAPRLWKEKAAPKGAAKFREETSKKADSAVSDRIAAMHNVAMH